MQTTRLVPATVKYQPVKQLVVQLTWFVYLSHICDHWVHFSVADFA